MGDKELSTFVNSILPEDIQNRTLGDLIASEDVELTVKKGKLRAHRDFGDKRVSLFIQSAPGYEELDFASVDQGMSQDEKRDMAKKLYKQGKTQEEIAGQLGVSQPYISRLLDKKTKRKKK